MRTPAMLSGTRRKSGFARRSAQRITSAIRPVEELEQRMLLTCVDMNISAAQRSALLNGLNGVSDWLSTISEVAQAAVSLPVIGETVGKAVNMADMFTQRFVNPLSSYLSSDLTPTTNELITFMAAQGGPVGNLAMTISGLTGGHCTSSGVDKLDIAVVVDIHRDFTTSFGLGAKGEEFGLKFDNSINIAAEATLHFDFGFGMDLGAGIPAADAFFIRPASLQAHAEATLATIPTGGMNTGLYDVTLGSGNAMMTATLGAGITDPSPDAEGRITLTDLTTADWETLVSYSGSASASGSLTLNTSGFGGFVPPAHPTISFSTSSGFDQLNITLSGFGELENFLNSSARNVTGLFEQLESWLDNLTLSDVLNGAVKVLENTTYGAILPFGRVLGDFLLGDLLDTEGQPKFDSVQGLATLLQAALPGVGINPTYNPATHDLTYHLEVNEVFAAIQKKFGVNFEMDPVVGFKSSSMVDINAEGSFEFTLGINLGDQVATLTGKADVPANGRLSADAHLALSVGAEIPVNVTVTSASTSTNADIADLVVDVDLALAAAGLNTKVAAGSAGNRLTISTKGTGVPALLLIGVDDINTAHTELHFDDGQLASDSLSKHAYIEGATIHGEATLSVPDADAEAVFGPVSIAIVNGTASAGVTVDMGLKDPASGVVGGRVDFGELFGAVFGDISSVISGPNIQGSVTAVLPMVVTPNFFGEAMPGNPRIVVNWTDIKQLSTLDVTFPDCDKLLKLQNVNLISILNALSQVADWIKQQESLDDTFLTRPLPGINKSIAQLMKFADELAIIIDKIPKDPTAAVQVIDEVISDSISDPNLTIDVEMRDHDETFWISVGYHLSKTASLPLNLDLQALSVDAGGVPGLEGLGHLVSVTSSGKIDARVAANLELNFGFELGTGQPVPFVDRSTNLVLSAGAQGEHLNFRAGLGPLSFSIKEGMLNLDADNDLQTHEGTELTLRLDENVGHILLEDLGDVDPELDYAGQFHARLPMYFPTDTQHFGDIIIDIDDLKDIPGSIHIDVPNISFSLPSFDFLGNLGQLIQGIISVLETIKSALDTDVLSKVLPFVGDKLGEATKFIDNLISELDQHFESLLAAGAAESVEAIRELLFDAMGPGGLNLLLDNSGDGKVTLADVKMELADTDNDGLKDDRLDVQMKLGKDLFNFDDQIDFDTGLPALGLSIDGKVKLSLGFEWTLAFSLMRDAPYFFFNTEPVDELALGIHASIPDLHARGNLGFLQLDVTDEDADTIPGNAGTDVDGDHYYPSRFDAGLTVDIKDPIQNETDNNPNHLTFDDIFSGNLDLDQAMAVRLGGTADLNLNTIVSFNGEARFPSFSTDINIHWPFDTGGAGAADLIDDDQIKGDVPSIAFNNIQLNLGSFISDFTEPILRRVDKLIKPIKPVLNFLTTPLPLAKKFGLNVTPLDVAGTLGFVDTKFLNAVEDVVGLITALPSLNSAGGVYLPLGSFDFSGVDIRNVSDIRQINPHILTLFEPVQELAHLPGQGTVSSFFDTAGGAGFSFPIFSDPASAFGLLLGKDVNLFLLDLPELKGGAAFDIKFGPLIPPIPLFATLGGSVGFRLGLDFGYDTHGLRKFLDTGDPVDVFSGFFVSDTDHADGTGADIDEAKLTGMIRAGAELNIYVAKGGVRGGISAQIAADLIDYGKPDGKIHADEFLENLKKGFDCTFALRGKVTAFLEAYLKFFFGPERTYPIANDTLFDWTFPRDDCYPDRFHDNHSFASAADLGVGPGLHIDGPAIPSSDEEDWYKFEITREDDLDIDVRFSHAVGDIDLEVYNSSNVKLGESKTKKDRELVTLKKLPAGVYYIHVIGHTDPNEYKIYVEPAKTSATRVIYVNPADADEAHKTSYYTFLPGSDANSGLTYLKPKASLASVYASLDVGPNDLIVFDTGTHVAGATLAVDDAGATYTSSVAGGSMSGITIDSANTNYFYRFDIGGSGPEGITLAGTSTSNTIRNSLLESVPTGIHVVTDKPNLIEGNTSSDHGHGNIGIILDDKATTLVVGNTISKRDIGIQTRSLVADIYDNVISGNEVGVLSDGGVVGPGNPPPFDAPADKDPNDITANTVGILIPDSAAGTIIRFNRIFGNTATGIESHAFDSLILANDIHDNAVGMHGADTFGPGDWASLQFNNVHHNGIGIDAGDSSEVRFNKVHDNAIGIRATRAFIHHNVLYRNGDGLTVDGGRDVRLTNNTVYSTGNGITLANNATNITIRNNILWTTGGYALSVDAPSQNGYSGDYNNLFATGSGKVAFQGKAFDDLFDWMVEANSDLHSIGYTRVDPTLDNPQFVNLVADDFHLASNSTSIDAGDPASPFSHEPAPNFRIDLGAYGDTPEGSHKSPFIDLTYPNFYADLETNLTHTITWNTYNISGNLDIDLYRIGAGKVADIAVVAASAGSTTFNPSSFGITTSTGNRYRIRLTSVSTPAIFDESREGFSIITPGTSFFVDDASDSGDEYTNPGGAGAAAINSYTGDNRNVGTILFAPKAAIRPLLISYQINSGSTIFVDTGSYVHAIDLHLNGTPMAEDPLLNTINGTLITGPTNPLHIATINRANTFDDATTMDLRAADNMTVKFLTHTGGAYGIRARADSDNPTLTDLHILNNSLDGIDIHGASDNVIIDRVHVHDNGRDGIVVDSLLTRITYADVHDNGRLGMNLSGIGSGIVENSQIYKNMTGVSIVNPGNAMATFGHFDLAPYKGNLVHDNKVDGVYASGQITVDGNTVHDNGAYGIRLNDMADARRNVVYKNATGISAFGSTSDIIENRVYSHPLTGIEASLESNILRNVSYSNRLHGIHTKDFSGLIEHNLVYNIGDAPINVEGPGFDAELINNTVYEPCWTNVEPPHPTEIDIPWDWQVQLQWDGDHTNPPVLFTVPLWGVAKIRFGDPLGQNGGGTFNLGPGGDAFAQTTDPVPPGDVYDIDTEVVDLNMSSAMFGDIPGFGRVQVKLNSTGAPLPPPPPTGTGTGLLATYYDNGGNTAADPPFPGSSYDPTANLSGQFISRVDPQIDFDFGAGSPDPAIAPDTFSAQWLGQLQAQFSETYTLCTSTDDGGFLDLNGSRLINDPTYHGMPDLPDVTACGSISLSAGQKYDLRVVMFESSGGAGARLTWESPSTPRQIIPQSQLYPKEFSSAPNVIPSLNAVAHGSFFADLSWFGEDPNATGYSILRSRSGAPGTFYEIARVAGSSFQAESLPNTSYFYMIRAINPHGVGPDSNIVGPISTSPHGLSGAGIAAHYYNNQDRSGPPTLQRKESQINLNFGGGSPDPSVTPDNFSIKFTGRISAQISGVYQFISTTDDGAFLKFNGQTVINDPNYHGVMDVFSTPVTMTAGQTYPIVFEMFEGAGDAVAILKWLRPDGITEVIPSSRLIANMLAPAPPPSALVATNVLPRAITLQWIDNTTSEFNYFIERSTSPTFSGAFEVGVVNANVNTFTDTSVLPGQTYFYRVRGGNWDAYGAYGTSGGISTPPEGSPPPPADFSVVARPGQMRLHWTDSSGLEQQYVVERRPDSFPDFSTIATLPADSTSFIDTDPLIVPGASFVYRLYATNGSGPSPTTPEINIIAGGAGGTGLAGSYYDNPDLTSLVASRIDPVINMNAGLGSPIAAIADPDTFSIRWKGEVQAEYSELYTFNVETDDGVRLYVGNQLLVDAFVDQGAAVHTGQIELVASQRYPIVMEYYDNTLHAIARLRWQSPSTPLETIPQSLLFPALPQAAASTGRISVQNIGGFLSGTAFFDINVEFNFLDLGQGIINAAPMRIGASFGPSSGFTAFDALRTGIDFDSSDTTPLLDGGGDFWGIWYQAEGDTSPHDQPQLQDKGNVCPEIGVIIQNYSDDVTLRNNIIYIEGDQNLPRPLNAVVITVDSTSRTYWDSDHNNLMTTWGNIGRWNGVLAPTLLDWQILSKDDLLSISPDINTVFADPDGIDNILGFGGIGITDGRDDNFHLRSMYGQMDQGAHAPVENILPIPANGRPEFLPLIFNPMPATADVSPSIDWGDPASLYFAEPMQNGQWINQGAYGNTIQASISPPRFLYVETAIGAEELVPGQTYNLLWRTHDYLPNTTISIQIDSPTRGTYSIVGAAPNTGSFLWAVPFGLDATDWIMTIQRTTPNTVPGFPPLVTTGYSRHTFSIGDIIPPRIIAATPYIVRSHGYTNDPTISQITLSANERLNPALATAAGTYQLRSAGVNNTFDDGDDLLLTLSPSYNAATFTITLAIAPAPLGARRYRLTVSGLTDIAGNALDGNAIDGDNDPFGADPFVRIFNIDFTSPTFFLPPISPNPRNSPIAAASIVFDEPMLGFGMSDLRLSRDGGANLLTGFQTISTADGGQTWSLGNLTDLTADEGIYELCLTGPGSQATDRAGNALLMSSCTNWTVDNTPPTALFTRVADPRNIPVPFIDITFSEPVFDFDVTDLELKRNGVVIALSGISFTTGDFAHFTINGLSALTGAEGQYVLRLLNTGVHDLAGNASVGNTVEAFRVDTTPPSVDIVPVSPDPRNSSVGQVFINFSEPVFGLTLGNLSLLRGVVSVPLIGVSLTGPDDMHFVLSGLSGFTSPDGAYSLQVDVTPPISDRAGNLLPAGASENWLMDTSIPTVQFIPVSPDPRGTSVAGISIIFSEPVSGFDMADLSFKRDSGLNLLSSAQTLSTSDNIQYFLGNLDGLTLLPGAYTLTLTASGSGILDAAGSALAAGATDSFTITASGFPANNDDDTYYIRLHNYITVQVYHNIPPVGGPTYTLSFATLSTLNFDTLGGKDSLTVDFSTGNPIPAGGLFYNGGAPNIPPGDTLHIIGNGIFGFSDIPSATLNGAGDIYAGGVIHYTGLEPITATSFQSFSLITPNPADNITLTQVPDNGLLITGSTGSVGFESVTLYDTPIVLLDIGQADAGGGSDTILLPTGLPPGGKLIVNAGTGNNTLTINGGTTFFDLSAGPEEGTHVAVTLNNNAISTIDRSHTLASLTMNGTSSLSLNFPSDRFIRTSALAMSSFATLDLGANDLIVDATPATRSAVLASITARIASARNINPALWTGPGITSSAAATDASHLTGLAVLLNDNNGSPLHTTFAGQTVDKNAILVKYTWNGDADESGVDDADDYFRIDSGFAAQDTGYYNGDFDYSGTVDADDYFLIDSAFGGQSGVLAAGEPRAHNRKPRIGLRRPATTKALFSGRGRHHRADLVA